ncbi:MAG: alpha/beta fold hydrolase [Aestuariibacter sp.]
MAIINFAHANGFPAPSYNKLWRLLPGDHQIIAKPMYGHDEHRPVSDNWQNQVEELLAFVKTNADEPVIAVGHSFGGVISFMACCQAPELFKGLIMLDPPIVAGMVSRLFRVLKKTPLIDSVVPSGKSKYRKSEWQPDEDLHAYFKPKALFRYFDEECLADYIRSATVKDKEGARLIYKVAIETQIFRYIPHNIHHFDGKLKVPAYLYTAEHTNVCFPYIARRFQRCHPGMKYHVIPKVGHMFPLEKPQQTAQLLAELIAEIDTKQGSSDAA